jgi:cytochrome c-type biogenesis protein CcmH/NrfF
MRTGFLFAFARAVLLGRRPHGAGFDAARALCLSPARRSGAGSQGQALMETLRCLKCQGQSIADSDAPMAGDMRSQVRQRIAAGEEPEAIRAG